MKMSPVYRRQMEAPVTHRDRLPDKSKRSFFIVIFGESFFT